MSEDQSQDELMKMALESVNTEQQAKDLLENRIKDAFLVKALMEVENKVGFLLILVSEFKNEILLMYSIFGSSSIIKRISTFEKYTQIMENLIMALKSGGMEKVLSDRVGRTLYRAFDKKSIVELMHKWKVKDMTTTITFLREVIGTEMRTKTISVQVEVEKISSVVFRTNDNLSANYKPIANPMRDVTVTLVNPTVTQSMSSISLTKTESEIEQLQKQFKQIVICKTVISPAAGVDFDKLTNGQKILFSLPFQTEEEMNQAKQLGAVDSEGKNRPVIGQFLKLVTGEKNEFHIFAKGPQGVLLRAFEERPVKLAVPKSANKIKPQDTDSGAMNIVLIVSIAIVVLLFAILISSQ